MSYTDLFIVAYCCLSALLHLLEVCILYVRTVLRRLTAVAVAIVATTVHVRTWLCALLCTCLIHLLSYSVELCDG